MTAPADRPPGCLVPLQPVPDVERDSPAAAEHDLRQRGRVRFLTRAIAPSMTTWQITTRAEQAFAVMRRLDRPTITLICLYTSLLNGCQYCIDDAAGAALDEGIPASLLLALEDLSAAPLDEATAAKLSFAAWVAMDPGNIPADVVERLRDHADDEELLELATAVAMKVFWNRLMTALRIPPEGRCTDRSLFAALLEVSERLRAGAPGRRG